MLPVVVVVKTEKLGLTSEIEVVAARRVVTEWAREIGLTVLHRTMVVTAASELARNTVVHGKGGVMSLEMVRSAGRDGLRLTFDDDGPGIADIERALTDGYSTGGSMGMGLPGAKRLVNEFALRSTVGVGTCVSIIRWKA